MNTASNQRPCLKEERTLQEDFSTFARKDRIIAIASYLSRSHCLQLYQFLQRCEKRIPVGLKARLNRQNACTVIHKSPTSAYVKRSTTIITILRKHTPKTTQATHVDMFGEFISIYNTRTVELRVFVGQVEHMFIGDFRPATARTQNILTKTNATHSRGSLLT